jgi:hypothetical protein
VWDFAFLWENIGLTQQECTSRIGEIIFMLPSRTYKPDDFVAEAKRIEDTCEEIGDVPLETTTYRDKDGNIFTINILDGTITVN